MATLSDSSGHIYDPDGIDLEKLAFVKFLKNVRRGRIREYVDKYRSAVYTPYDPALDHNPLWGHRADAAFPCATQNEIGEKDAYILINNNIKLVCEGSNMPCSSEAIAVFLGKKILLAPGKAANAGGVAVSGVEMALTDLAGKALQPYARVEDVVVVADPDIAPEGGGEREFVGRYPIRSAG